MKRWLPFLLFFATTACGPTVPILAGFRQGAANIFFGQASPAPAPPLPFDANPVPNFPAPLEAPVPEFAVESPPAGPCPEAPAEAYPDPAAPATPSATPPRNINARFRYQGQKVIDPGHSDQKVLTLPASGTRAVTQVASVGTTIQFTVEEHYNGFDTKTTYDSFPNGPAPNSSVPGETPAAGLYIAQIVTTNADGSKTDRFSPASPVEIFPYPASPGVQYQGAGTDPLTQETMEIDPNGGVVDGRDRVNACGTPLDSWHATMTGRMVNARGGPGGVTTFSLKINVATQFGAVIIGDHLVEDGTDSDTGVPFHYDVQSWIDGL